MIALVLACALPEPAETTPAGTTPPLPLALDEIAPALADPIGGSRLTVRGSGFTVDLTAELDGSDVLELVVVSDTELQLVTPPTAAPWPELVLSRGELQAALAIEAWSPADLPGARLFDAATGTALEEPGAHYEWQRLTADIHPDWRVRDGNTLTWMPSHGLFFMVAGWNPFDEPAGFGADMTTDEVWSSPDGVSWTLELAHGHAQFERRHSHNTMLFQDQLWVIGGDHHQGFYNHDVVSSPDGVNWTVHEAPWSERGVQVSGVYAGKLWTAGGQDLVGYPDAMVHHNDVWSSEDGVTWTQVVPDAPASETRWGGCGVMDGLVEFRGEMWLVGCARVREDVQGHTMFDEVWSTTDGVTWRQHAQPPWAGKIWHNVVVWDDKLWILFGFTYGDIENGWPVGNANEVWYSEDGDSWRSLPPDAPVPGSHAQGVAVTEDHLWLAGGNYGFGFGAGEDRSSWRLARFHGEAARSWTDRGDGGLVATAPSDDARPLRVPDAFGAGVPGLHFDGSSSALDIFAPDAQSDGRSVFWVARSPWQPIPYGWVETYNPMGTVVGGAIAYGYPSSSAGMSEGQVVLVNREPGTGVYGEPLWSRSAAGQDLQDPDQTMFLGLTHALDGTLRFWADGAPLEPTSTASYDSPRSWTRLGGGIDGAAEGPHSRFAGTLGAVIVLPSPADDATVARMHAWAQGRFGVR